MATDKKPIPERREIASRARDVFNPPWGGILRPEDSTLASQGGTDGIRIYDELENDPTAFAALQKRKMAVVARPWQVNPASEAPLDKRAADVVRAQLEAFNFDEACAQLLDALLKGYAVSEIMWEMVGSEVVLKEMIPRNQRRFTFDENAKLRHLTFADMLRGEELPDRKFVVHSCGSKDGNPFGLGIGTRLFWPVFFKRQSMGFWLVFADKFGSPTIVGEYPPGTSAAERNDFIEVLGGVSQDAVMTIPQGMVVRLLEAARTGGMDGYEMLMRWLDEMILQAILGESNSSRESGGALAAASLIRNEVRMELTRADADLLSSTINKSLVRWITEFNVPGAQPPKVWRKVEAGEDLDARAVRDKTLFDMGYKLDHETVLATYGAGYEAVQAPPQTPAPAPENKPAPLFSAPSDADVANAALDAMLEALPPQALNEQARQMLQPVIDAIFAAGSYEEMLTAIDRVVPGLKMDKLETALGRAMFVAQTYGYGEAARESNSGHGRA